MAGLTYSGYIQNPIAKNNAVFGQADVYRKLYTEKFDKVLARVKGKIDYKLYVDKQSGSYYIYIKIPSEVIDKFVYDVVIEFSTEDKAIMSSKTLKDYGVRFYSNDPSFVFTFANVFLDNDMFIKELSAKMSAKALKEKPDIRNPNEYLKYVKSLYFAYLYIKNKGLMNKIMFDTYGSKMDFKMLLHQIEHADSKIASRQKAQEDLDKKKHQDQVKQNEEKRRQTLLSRNPIGRVVNNVVQKTKLVTSTPKTNAVKRSKYTKKT